MTATKKWMGQIEQLKPDCRRATARMPMLLSGSLEPAERESLRAHLSTCADCLGEFESIELAWDVFDVHIPSFQLAAHALGWSHGELSAETIEAHLAHCESCRVEFEAVAEAENGTSAETLESSRAGRVWLSRTAWASVAAAALIVVFSFLGGQAPVESGPEPIARADFESGAASLQGAGEIRFVSGRAAQPSETSVAAERRVTGRQVMLFSDGFESGMPVSWKETHPSRPVEGEVEDPAGGEHNGSERAGAIG